MFCTKKQKKAISSSFREKVKVLGDDSVQIFHFKVPHILMDGVFREICHLYCSKNRLRTAGPHHTHDHYILPSIACCSGSSLQSWLPGGLIQTPGPGSSSGRGRNGLGGEDAAKGSVGRPWNWYFRKQKQKSQLEEHLALCCSAGGHQARIHNS